MSLQTRSPPGRPIPEHEVRILPSAPAPIPRKPILALAVCGAVVMVPLALAVPGPPEAEEEVLVATGSPGEAGDGGEAGAGDGSVDVPVPELDAGAEAEVQAQSQGGTAAPRQAVTARNGTRSSTGRSSPTSRRSWVAGLLGRKKTTTTTRPAPVTASSATAARIVRVTATTAAPPPPPPPTTRAPAPTSSDLAWDRLAVCESGNTNDHGAPYYGYWQFSAETWRSVGESGLPDQFSRAHQLAAAKRLHALRGWSPWPTCSRRLGLT